MMIVRAKAACGAVVQFFAQLISVRRINHEFDDVAGFKGFNRSHCDQSEKY